MVGMLHNVALQLQKQEKECFHENAVVCLLWALFVCLFMLCAGVRPLPTGVSHNLSSDRQNSEGPWEARLKG